MDGLAVAGSCRRSLGVHTGSSAVLLILYPQWRRRGDETVGRAASHFGPAETRRVQEFGSMYSETDGLIKRFYF
jgi:hypothetical protein